MSALEKVLALAGQAPPAGPDEDVAGDLVRAARTCLTELRAYLADSGSDDEDGDEGKDEEGSGHSSHPTFKALKKRGMDDGKAGSLCARADKRVKAAAQAEAALLALASLDAPARDWVEATAHDRIGAVALTGRPGGLAYADPGYRGKQRFLIDSEASTRLSLAYSRQDEHTAGYSAEQLAAVHERIADAARSFGISLAADADSIAAGVLLGMSVLSAGGSSSGLPPISDRAHLTAAVSQYKQGKYAGCAPAEIRSHILRHASRLGTDVDLSGGSGLEEAAELVALAAKPVGDGGIIMNHGPFNGTHAHGHFQSNVHHHPHQHFGDNHHDGGPAHRPGSQPGGRAGW